jgi:hypothetical protein
LTYQTLSGETKELFMSYGLLKSLCGFVGGLERLDVIFMTTEGFDGILYTVFGPRDARGRLIDDEEFSTDTLDVAPAELERIVGWAQEHVVAFFLGRAKQLAKTGQKTGPELQRLNSLLAGLQNSTSNELPAGPSTASRRT